METKHYPRLDTILRVERLLMNQSYALSVNEIMDKLPKKIMRSTLHTILKYLMRSKKVMIVNNKYKWSFGQSYLNPTPTIENNIEKKEEQSNYQKNHKTNRIEKLVQELENSTTELEKIQEIFKNSQAKK